MKKSDLNRRELLKKTLLGSAALSTLGVVACTKSENNSNSQAKAPAKPAESSSEASYVSESDNVAKTLNYKENADAVSADLRADKGNTKGSEQYCNNCQFYTEGDAEGGKCALFPGKLVKSKAWCKSWSLKAQA